AAGTRGAQREQEHERGKINSSAQTIGGRFRVPRFFSFAFEPLLLLFLGGLFLCGLLGCHVFYSPFESATHNVAIVECIELSKIDVKRKKQRTRIVTSERTRECMVLPVPWDPFSNSLQCTSLYFTITNAAVSAKLSCIACAIIPGRRLLRITTRIPNITP